MSWIRRHGVRTAAPLAGRVVDAAGAPRRPRDPQYAIRDVLTQALARQLKRPAFVRAPAFALKLLLGELSAELLGSRRCVPRRAESMGFRFTHAALAGALDAELV